MNCVMIRKMMRILLLIVLSIPATALAQEEINQTDSDGLRHGTWKKYYPGTQQLRYQGTFEHGQEVGEFRFYCEECGDQPSVIKKFESGSDLAEVTYYTIKGQLVSRGNMRGKQRVGEWVYYHKGREQVMTREFYEAGVLHGLKTTYYPDGTVTEEINYVNGKKEGPNKFYSPEGQLLKDLNHSNDELHGPATYYDAQGGPVIKGSYKAGKKDGLWTYYAEGQLVSEERFPKPRKKKGQ